MVGNSEWYVGVNLEHYLHDGHSHLVFVGAVYAFKVRSQSVYVAAGVGFDVEVEGIVVVV